MQTIDFSRSFLTFRLDMLKKPPQTVSHQPPYSLNNARIQLDCVCDITEKASGQVDRYVLGASCKTERVGVPSDIWTVPNADFIPIVSADRFLNIKTYAYLGQEHSVTLFGHNKPQPDRQTGTTAEAFDTLKIHVHETPGQWLQTPEEIIAATYENLPLTACTAYSTERYAVALWYPVKTFNVNERDNVYQTDTGPMLFPDLSRSRRDMIEGFELAYSAFNGPEWIEFLVREPVDVPGGARVYHYTKPVRVEGVSNKLIRPSH